MVVDRDAILKAIQAPSDKVPLVYPEVADGLAVHFRHGCGPFSRSLEKGAYRQRHNAAEVRLMGRPEKEPPAHCFSNRQAVTGCCHLHEPRAAKVSERCNVHVSL